MLWLPYVLHAQAKHNTDTPMSQGDNCRVHKTKSVCDQFEKHDGTLGHFDWTAKSPVQKSHRKLIAQPVKLAKIDRNYHQHKY